MPTLQDKTNQDLEKDQEAALSKAAEKQLGKIKNQREISELQVLLDNKALELKKREGQLLQDQEYVNANKKITNFGEIARELNEEVLANRRKQSRTGEVEGNEIQLTKSLQESQNQSANVAQELKVSKELLILLEGKLGK